MQRILQCARRGSLAATALAILGAAALSGCSSMSWLHFGSDDEAYDYRKAKPRQEPLEVPPDLSQLPKDDRYALPSGAGGAKPGGAGAGRPGDATGVAPSGVASAEAGGGISAAPAAPAGVVVAPSVTGARIVRDGNQRWLEIDGSPEVAYATIKDLFSTLDYKIEIDDPRLGIVETDWVEVHPMVNEDVVRNSLHKILGAFDSNGERNKFRARIERTPKNTAIVTITQRGMEEIFVSPEHETTKWQARPPRPELEAEMLQRLALRFAPAQPLQVAVAPSASAPSASATDALSAGPAAAAATPAVESRVHKVTAGGLVTLQVEDSLDRTWRRVGIALDRGGFTIEERNRDKNTYAVRYLDPEYEAAEREKRSWWDRLFHPDAKIPEQQFRIVISANGPTTAVEIQDREGKYDTGATAGRILDQIMEQLR